MARMLDDASRARLLSTLLDQQTPENDGGFNNEPKVTAMPPGTAPRPDDAEQVDDAMPGPLPSDGNSPAPGMRGEPMIPVPASLAHAGMQALMMQASGGKSMGADGALPGLMGSLDEGDDMPTNRGPDVPADAYSRTPTKKQIDKSDSMSDAPAGRRRRG